MEYLIKYDNLLGYMLIAALIVGIFHTIYYPPLQKDFKRFIKMKLRKRELQVNIHKYLYTSRGILTLIMLYSFLFFEKYYVLLVFYTLIIGFKYFKNNTHTGSVALAGFSSPSSTSSFSVMWMK